MRASRWPFALLPGALLFLVSGSARGFDIDGGVSVGAMALGSSPRLAVSPHAALSARTAGGALFSVRGLCSVLPATGKLGVGVYNQISVTVGYAWDGGDLSVGPAVSVYSAPACGETLCGRVVGIAPGGHARASLYFAGPLGVSVSASVDWVSGRSLVLPGGLAGTLVAGPVVRWSST